MFKNPDRLNQLEKLSLTDKFKKLVEVSLDSYWQNQERKIGGEKVIEAIRSGSYSKPDLDQKKGRLETLEDDVNRIILDIRAKRDDILYFLPEIDSIQNRVKTMSKHAWEELDELESDEKKLMDYYEGRGELLDETSDFLKTLKAQVRQLVN